MANKIIGKVSITPRGQYNSGVTYEPLDVVQYNGGSYIVRQQCTGITPADGEYYMLAAERGEQGPRGERGETGETGPQGPKGADGTMSFEDLTPEQKASLKGDKGDTGPQGPAGPAGPQGPSGEGVGKSMAGKLVKPAYDTELYASDGSEIFNDYRERLYTFNVAREGNIASGQYSHAEGAVATASGDCSHAEGCSNVASGERSHAEGSQCNAAGFASHAEGGSCEASGSYSHVEGANCKAKGDYSHASGIYSISHYLEFVIGFFNVDSQASDEEESDSNNLFIVGNGSSTINRSNVFRIKKDGIHGSTTFTGTGADYAEMFEWKDGNPDAEDRVGRFVTLDGTKIRLAQSPDEFILGIVSGAPTIVGDVHNDQWHDMYLRDVFGRTIWEDVEVPECTDERGRVIPAHTVHREKINPDYNPEQRYIARSDRPEWGVVGMLGKLVAIDDGTCEVNGWCEPSKGGIATRSEAQTKFRCMERIDGTHIRVLIL